MKKKKFKLKAKDIQPLVEGYGACFATDLITVEGNLVQYMYRESSDRESDSGWRFLSGLESEEYMKDSANIDVYHVNTIANYDQEIIPLLDSPVGSAFERDETGVFVEVDDEDAE